MRSTAPRSLRPAPAALAALLAPFVAASCTRSTPTSTPTATATSTTTTSAPAPSSEPALTEDEKLRRDLARVMSPPELDACFGKRGLVVKERGATPGFTLVMPLNGREIHLVDLDGAVVHTWRTGFAPGGWCTLLDDGTLLFAGRIDQDPRFRGGGIGGAIRRFARDGSVVWSHDFADDARWQHHDVEPLPNGHLLVLAWERKSRDEAIAKGRDPRGVGDVGLWPDAVFEVKPILPAGGEIVWEWHAWDHLVQDRDPAKPGYGKLADHPGRVDVNAAFEPPEEQSDEAKRAIEARLAQMAALGYGGNDAQDAPADAAAKAEPKKDDEPKGHDWSESGDWLHTNAVAYDAEHDLIVLSSPHLCEVWILDHGTTTAEAAGSRGGRRGRGGEILWRWGNPIVHGAGTEDDRRLFYQHDPSWQRGPGGEPRLLVFNNGGERPGGDRSSVDELVLPFDARTGFAHEPGRPFGPAGPVWSFERPGAFFSAFISGAARLPNGNTLVTSGAAGRIFEVTPAGEIVWDYLNPFGGEVEPPEHAGKAPRNALFRSQRYAPDHPGIRVVLGTG